jgi:CxxC motif-containing protein
MELTCIMCPVGCSLKVEKIGNEIIVTGNRCPRGKEYGKNEAICPKRMVTTVIKTKKGTICIKTDKPIDKKLIDDCLRLTKTLDVPKNVKVGNIIAKNVLESDVNLVVTEINENI